MTPQHWTHLNRKDAFKHPRLYLVEDEVKLPSGAITTYLREAPTSRNSVTTIALNEKGHILLQQEYSYPPDEILWQLPGGTVEDGEDILTAANRELSEESGLAARQTEMLGYYYTNNRRSNQKQYVVLCTDLVTCKIPEDAEEFIISSWVPISELKRKVQYGEIHNMNLLATVHLWFAHAQATEARILP